MNIIYLKKFIQYISILLIFALISPVKADNHNVIKVGDLLKLEGKFADTKLVLVSKNRARQLIVDAIESIENKCCDENFPKKSEAIEIKNILQECLENKCQNFMVPLYNKKKPPAKILALKLVDKVDDIILENESYKYNQLSKKFEESRLKKLKNEKDAKILKSNIEELENENKKLKKTVDKMLKNYQTKIIKLEKQNKELQEDFEKAYGMLSKPKQRKFNKK